MKKIKKIFCLILMAILGTISVFAQAAEIVHDPINNIPIVSNMLYAIDQLYSTYDMITNSITQIENQYKAINQAIENAKGIDWENIHFDGDLDIRDDIRDANKRVNRLLTQVNTIKDSLNTTIITTGDQSYSLADICGAGDDGKDFASCVENVFGYMKDNMLQAAAYAVGNLTEEQEKAIWQKYGISPQNFYLVSQASKLVQEKASFLVAQTTDEAKKLLRDEKMAALNDVVKAAMESKTADGTIPEGALEEATMLATSKMVDECILLKDAVNYAAGTVGQKILLEEKEKQAQASEKQMQAQSTEILNNNVPGNFAAGRTKTTEK